MDIAKKLLVIMVAGIIGAISGIIYAREFIYTADNCHILYVAEDELMSLEEDRVKNDNLDTRQLFFGEIGKAVDLAVSLPKAYQNRTTKVLYSISSIKGHNVKSISSEIHGKIIKELSKSAKINTNN